MKRACRVPGVVGAERIEVLALHVKSNENPTKFESHDEMMKFDVDKFSQIFRFIIIFQSKSQILLYSNINVEFTKNY